MGVNKLLLRSSKDKPGITALTRYSKWIINALITRGVLSPYSGLKGVRKIKSRTLRSYIQLFLHLRY